MLIKTDHDIAVIREGGRILAGIVEKLSNEIRPGVSTLEIDALAEKYIRSFGGVPSFKGYRGRSSDPPFPGTICASLNDEVVHGIPRSDRILQEGDLFKLDIGMRYKDRYTDMARTFAVGRISWQAQKVLDVTRESLEAGSQTLRDGSTIREYARIVQRYVESFGFSLVRDLVGHGVGYEVHEPPQIPNCADVRTKDFTFKKNMVVALEPMVNAGGWQIKLSRDGWTFETADHSLSAHFENTYAITKTGAEILTAA